MVGARAALYEVGWARVRVDPAAALCTPRDRVAQIMRPVAVIVGALRGPMGRVRETSVPEQAERPALRDVGRLAHLEHPEPGQSQQDFGEAGSVAHRQRSSVVAAVRQPQRCRDL
jgi:hypothetical protein